MRKRLLSFAIVAFAAFASPPVHAQTSSNTGTTPDLSGVWRRTRHAPDNARKYTIYELTFRISSDEPPMTPWATAKFKTAKPNVGPNSVTLAQTNDPLVKCYPPGVPRVYLVRAEPLEIMQIPGRVVMVFEYDHFVRNIYMDGRQHNKDLPATWMGDSIGKWEGDTLVVDSTGFNDKTWLDNDGHPHTEDLHLLERIRRVNHETMTIDLTIEDPKAYTKPWGGHLVYELKPGWELGEMVCEDNETFSEMQKKSEGNK